MSSELIRIDREILLAELERAFDAHTSEILLGVLDKVAAQVRDGSPTLEDFRDLKQVVADLAEAQRQTEVTIRELATKHEERLDRIEAALERLTLAQQRSEERLDRVEAAIERLTQAQQRSEERLDRVEAAIERLTQAQQRSEERLDRLEAAIERLALAQARTEDEVKLLREAQGRTERALERLSKQVGGLSETVGGDIEDIAYIVLHDVLNREFGWRVGQLERVEQMWDNEPVEFDVFGQASDPDRPEECIWIVGEAKHILSMKEVEKFIELVRRARQNLTGEVFPVCFCYRARPEVRQQIQDAGLRLVFSYGRLV